MLPIPGSALPAGRFWTSRARSAHAPLYCRGLGQAQRGAQTSRFAFPRFCRRDGGCRDKGVPSPNETSSCLERPLPHRALPGMRMGSCLCVRPGAQWSPASWVPPRAAEGPVACPAAARSRGRSAVLPAAGSPPRRPAPAPCPSVPFVGQECALQGDVQFRLLRTSHRVATGGKCKSK